MIGDPVYARRFAADHAHVVGDLPLWRALAAAHGGPVLDLGAAVGRVAIPLAEDGHEVWALDGDPNMLAELAQRAAIAPEVAGRIRTIPADIRDFDLGVRFPLAICAMNTLQVLLDVDDQLACLRAVAAHLAPGGAFWFDVAMPDVGEIAASLGLIRDEGRNVDAETGMTRWHRSWFRGYDAIDGTAEYTHEVQDVAPDGTLTIHRQDHTVHLYQPPELLHLLARAGLRVVDRFGDFRRTPLDLGASHQVVCCEVDA